MIDRIGQQSSWQVAEGKHAEIARLPIEIIALDDNYFWDVVGVKATCPMSYADGFAAASAVPVQVVLLTSDPELESPGNAVSREKP